MKDVIIKCGKGEVKKTLAYIEKKDRKVKWATGDKPTGYGGWFEKNGVYLVIENDVLTFIYVDEFEKFENFDKKGKTVVSAYEFLGKSKSPHIVIFQRGRNVIAKDVATGNDGIAKCSPDDEFCFKTGASIALARLMAKTPDALNHDVKDEWIKVLGLTPVEKKVYTDADRNFEVGDRVVVRNWDDMAKEYGVYDGSGTIKCPNGFTVTMKHLCGRTAVPLLLQALLVFPSVLISMIRAVTPLGITSNTCSIRAMLRLLRMKNPKPSSRSAIMSLSRKVLRPIKSMAVCRCFPARCTTSHITNR